MMMCIGKVTCFSLFVPISHGHVVYVCGWFSGRMMEESASR